MNNRTQSADLLKGIAVLFMIQVHIIELFAVPQISSGTIGKYLLFLGGPFVAPVFVFFLGFFLADSEKSTGQLISRGVRIFFLGMLLNLALNFNLIVSVLNGKFSVDLCPYIFGVDILPFAGLAIILTALFKSGIRKYIYVVLFAAFVSAFLGHYFLCFIPDSNALKYISSFFYGSSKWSYFPLFPWLAYLLLGIAFFKLRQQFDLDKVYSLKTKAIVLILFLTFLIFTVRYAISVASDLQQYYHHGLLFFLWASIFMAFYGFFVNEINRIAGDFSLIRYIKWLGKNVTFIYVIQWIIIGNWATEIYKTISSPLYLTIDFILVLSLTGLLTYAFTGIKNRLFKAS